jgi:hypothetical protein
MGDGMESEDTIGDTDYMPRDDTDCIDDFFFWTDCLLYL